MSQPEEALARIIAVLVDPESHALECQECAAGQEISKILYAADLLSDQDRAYIEKIHHGGSRNGPPVSCPPWCELHRA